LYFWLLIKLQHANFELANDKDM